jgi:WXG100 family type VII secretion target
VITTNIRVTPELVHEAAANCTTTAAEIDAQLSALRSYVSSLEEIWRGIAQDTFQELMSDYDIYARMMHDALTDIATGLTTNQFNYVDKEAANIRNLKPVHGTLMPGQPGFHLPPNRF